MPKPGLTLPGVYRSAALGQALTVPWATGRFYSSPIDFAATTTKVISGWHSCPIYVPNPAGVTVTSIGIEVTAFAAVNTRLGIYAIDENGDIGNLVLDAGTVSLGTSNAFKSIGSLTQLLPQGWYWIVGTNDVTTNVTVRALNAGPVALPWFGRLSPDSNSSLAELVLDQNSTITARSYYADGLPGTMRVTSATGTYPRYMVGV